MNKKGFTRLENYTIYCREEEYKSFIPYRVKAQSFLTGFTLVEILVVIVVFAIMLGLAMMSLNRFTPGYRLRGSTEEVAGVYRSARAKAVMRGSEARVRYDNTVNPPIFWVEVDTSYGPLKGGGFWRQEGGVVKLKRGVLVDRYLPNALQFRQDGSCVLGQVDSVVLRNEKNWRGSITVIPVTGMAHVVLSSQ